MNKFFQLLFGTGKVNLLTRMNPDKMTDYKPNSKDNRRLYLGRYFELPTCKTSVKITVQNFEKEEKIKRLPLSDLSTNNITKDGTFRQIQIAIKKELESSRAVGAKALVQKRKRSKSNTDEVNSVKLFANCKRFQRSKSVTEYEVISPKSDIVPPEPLNTVFPNEVVESRKRSLQQSDIQLKIREFLIDQLSSDSNTVYNFDVSPICQNLFTDSESLLAEPLFTSRRKPKIKKSYAVPFSDETTPYACDINNLEYLEDNFQFFLWIEDRQLLENDFLSKYNPLVIHRILVVNWIFKIQELTKLPDNEIYVAIYIFDKTLASTEVPTNMYQLVAITSIWISNKLGNTNAFQASTLTSLCGNVYLTQEMCRLEQKILKIINFRLYITDPTLFINYALRLLHVENNELLMHLTHFIIDCFALNAQFSSTPASLMSFAAVNVALKMFHKKKTNFFEYVDIIGGIPNLEPIEKQLIEQIIEVKKPENGCKAVINKYNTTEKMYVSVEFFKEGDPIFIIGTK